MLLLLLLLPLLPADCRLSTATLSLPGGLVRAWFPSDESARHETTRARSRDPERSSGPAITNENIKRVKKARERTNGRNERLLVVVVVFVVVFVTRSR